MQYMPPEVLHSSYREKGVSEMTMRRGPEFTIYTIVRVEIKILVPAVVGGKGECFSSAAHDADRDTLASQLIFLSFSEKK